MKSLFCFKKGGKMIVKKENEVYISASDWIHSATIVGLIQYFKFHNKQYEIKEMQVKDIFDEFLIFDKTDVRKEEYFEFVKEFYKIEDTEKYSTIEEFFLKKEHLYVNYCNKRYFFKGEKKAACRVRGYYFDNMRKERSTNWGFEKGIIYQDSKFFDFIHFAFVGNEHETLFLNNNYSLKTLEEIYLDFKNEEGENVFSKLINLIQNFKLRHSIEIIYKDKKNKYFETYFLSDNTIEALETVDIEKIDCTVKLAEEEYLNIAKEIFICALKGGNLNRTIGRIMNFYHINPSLALHDVLEEMIKLNAVLKKEG
ncbi:hypothetical protein A2U04_05235 [Fusobacterium necrophorum subsp. funduliforme]|nr:hypothetical protein A2U04_05235 [Fusobacterium necrophorum subsp. funduliforme]